MLYLTCTMISSVDLAHYGVDPAKDLGICGLWYNYFYFHFNSFYLKLLTSRSKFSTPENFL